MNYKTDRFEAAIEYLETLAYEAVSAKDVGKVREAADDARSEVCAMLRQSEERLDRAGLAEAALRSVTLLPEALIEERERIAEAIEAHMIPPETEAANIRNRTLALAVKIARETIT